MNNSNGFWIDDNGNKWDETRFSDIDAITCCLFKVRKGVIMICECIEGMMKVVEGKIPEFKNPSLLNATTSFVENGREEELMIPLQYENSRRWSRKKLEVVLIAKYCPFCGKELNKELLDENE